MSNAVVIQTAYLGDAVLTLPLINRLAQRFGPVDVVLTPASAQLLARQPSIRRVIPYDKRGTDRGIAGFRKVVRTLAAEGYERAFVPHRSLRSALLARMARIPERTGFTGGVAGRIHTSRVLRPAQGHETQRLLALSGDPTPVTAPWFHVGVDDRANAKMWLESKGIGPNFVVLAPGAAWTTKRWPYFAELARQLNKQIVVVGGSEDREMGEAIVLGTDGRARNAAGELSLIQSAAVISLASLVVCNDSLALHLASALARPVVAIVGPTGPAPGFGPFSPESQLLAHSSLACRPCSLHGHSRCPLGHHRCMRELGSQTVATMVGQWASGLVG